MRFKLIKLSWLLCLVLGVTSVVNAQEDSLAKHRADSFAQRRGIPDKLTDPLKRTGDVFKQEVLGLTNVNVVGQAKTDLNSLSSNISSKVKLLTSAKPFSLGKTELLASYSYPQDTSGVALGGYRSMQGLADYSLHGSFMTMSIPFNLDLDANNGFSTMARPPVNDFYSINFDPQKYRQLLQDQVLKKIRPEQVLSTLMSRIDKVRNEYEQKLSGELSSIQQQFQQKSGEILPIPQEITDLSKSDLTSLRSSMFKDFTPDKYAEQLKRLQELKAAASSAEVIGEMRKVEAAVGKYEALDKMFARFKEKKDQFENNKIVKELRSHLPFTPDKFREYLSKPGNLKDVISKYGSLSSIQSLFMSLTKLDLGQNPVQSGDLNMKDLLNTGLNTAFESKNAKAGLIVGKNNNVNNWMQGGLNSIVGNEYSGLTGITLGTGTNSRSEQSVSFNLFNFMNTPGMSDPMQQFRANYLANAPRQDAVITYHSAFKLGSRHEIKIDLSKSFGTYKNQQNDDSVRFTKTATDGLLGSEGKANYAAMVNYDGEVFNTPVQLMVKKVGMGYNNPGNIFLRRGETQVQLAFARNFLKQKLNIRYKTDYRHQQFDPEKRFIANTFSNKLQMNYRVRRNTRVGLSYQRSDYKTTSLYQANGNGASTTLQADGSYRFTIADKKISSTSTLNLQSMNLPTSAGVAYKNTTLLVVHTSSIPIQQNMLLLTLMGNLSKNKEYYFNTAFVNTEVSYVYAAGKGIRLSSGSGLYYNKGWNTQIGVKQSVTATLAQRLELDLNLDYRKAVRTIRPELANQLLIYSSVRYRF
ncbi:MAG: hypothetical protein DI535_14090 [Citrobacter freundii]|nr:MAG: hypothetical protein DI535_14090 [Citrobacter freundii]